ncbi:SPOSA6832_04921 [Sporobolomyces salmonicolor]|uniref:SPOSA6832_04921-mRNA-1:cds n=1 Tax=Sporidiobolus salmonicolor TaxID=5005 RepID=A0A0D6ET59_SPOSA|nr:SPOSA6832_04921 [Sporobolomyces salmonicolor]
MASSRRPHPPPQSAPSSPPSPRQSLLRELALSALPYSPQTALFYAERLHALEPATEPAAFLLAFVQHRNERHHEALWTLRQPVSFVPAAPPPPDALRLGDDRLGATAGTAGPSRRWAAPSPSTSSGKLVRPAVECSVRCARLYGQACLALGRDKEGRDALAAVIQPGVPLAPSASQDLALDSPSSILAHDDPTIVELELARLARKAGSYERAVQSYSRVLDKLPTCWEALEALCVMGAPPDVDVLYPPRPRSSTSVQTHPNRAPPASTSASTYPPPLGPSQTAAVNAPFNFGRPRNGDLQEGVAYGTPLDVGGGGALLFKPNGGLGPAAKGKAVGGRDGMLFGGGGGPPPLRRAPSARYGDITESSIDEASFDTSFYPSAPLFSAPMTANFASQASRTNSLFTPPAPPTLPTATAPGVKRTRAGNIAPASTAAASADDDTTQRAAHGRRVVRGVPGDGKTRRGDASATATAPATRRSSRLSRDTGSSTGAASAAASVGMTLSRSQTSANGRNAPASTAARDKKRSKANAGPSVLSDAGSDALSPPPPSHSSSPAPSSPGASAQQQHPRIASSLDPARQEAEDYVSGVLRCFARAEVARAKYEGAKCLEALAGLPVEQQRTARCLIGVAKAHFEMLNYDKAEKAFQQARLVAPHLLDAMELYSTALWHLRAPTALSFLAQELMLISPAHPSSWIAAGNVFSHVEDHAGALKCFKRAAQVDEGCVYAYTLSGHECIMLEEWERALGFFREAVRRDPLHYNAWFGFGNVYMKTGKYTLAEYHFRRALEINPTNATLACCVGSVLEKLRRPKEALEVYERACVLAPESPLARFNRVRMLLALQRYQTAESDLITLKQQAPSEPNVHYLLGKLYKLLGRRPEMLNHFALAQDLEPRMASVIREQIERSVSAEAGMDVDDSEIGGSFAG